MLNKIRGALNVCAVKAPGYGDRQRMLAISLSSLVARLLSMSWVSRLLTSLPICSVPPSPSPFPRTTPPSWVALVQEAIDTRIAQIKGELEHTDSDFDREKLQERLAKLSGGVACDQGWRCYRDRALARSSIASRTPSAGNPRCC